MAFYPYEPKNLLNELQNANQTFIRMESNILRRLTIGYAQLYKDINGKSTLNTPSSSVIRLDSNNNIILDDNSPLLDHRYKVIKLIGNGNFSNVYLVNDIYTTIKYKVIKVLYKGYQTMGIRECAILKHFNNYQSHSSMPNCKYILYSYLCIFNLNSIFNFVFMLCYSMLYYKIPYKLFITTIYHSFDTILY